MAYLSEEQHEIVSQAVAQAESTTSGEIVTVLADRSDGYTDVALSWAIGVSFTAMSLAAAFPDPILRFFDRMLGGWTMDWTRGEYVTLVLGIGLLAFFAMLLLQMWQRLKFALVPGPVKSNRALDAAIRLFKAAAESRTHGRTGVLLYLSMSERRAEIIADESIASRVSAEVWGAAMADMLAEVSQGRIAEGLAAGVRDVGKVLAEHFPQGDHDENELPDRLIEV